MEFDNFRANPDSLGPLQQQVEEEVGVPSTMDSHIAITTPSNNNVPHTAISALTTPYANNSINTVNITWKLVQSSDPTSVTDNVYEFRYAYYQGAGSAAGTPTHVGSVRYTYAQAQTLFNNQATAVYAGFSGSTASLVGNQQTLAFPATYAYTVNYYLRDANGNNTTIRVPGLAAKTGVLPAGPGDVGPLPNAPPGYELVPGQSTVVTISSTQTNTFNYYYRDLPPTLTAPNVTVERGTAFNPMSGVTATDGADGNITSSVRVTAGTVDTNTTGTYPLTYSVTDSGGNTVTTTRTVTVVDTTAPAAPTINPVSETATTVTGRAEAGSTVRVTLPGGTVVTTTAAADGTWSITTPAPLMGNDTVTATATDASNNTSAPGTQTVPIEYVSLQVTKQWSDPLTTTYPAASIDIRQDGTVVRTLQFPSGTTTQTATELRRFNPTTAQAYAYTVTEQPVAGYASTITGDMTAGYTVTNTRILADVTLTKANATGEGLAGAVFGLYAADGTALGQATTGTDGTLTFAALPTGDYYLQEITAPEGYRLATEQLAFSVTDSAPIQLTSTNEEILTTLPATGTAGALPYWGAAVLLLLLFAHLRRSPAVTSAPSSRKIP